MLGRGAVAEGQEVRRRPAQQVAQGRLPSRQSPTCALVAFCFSWSKAPARKVSAHTCREGGEGGGQQHGGGQLGRAPCAHAHSTRVAPPRGRGARTAPQARAAHHGWLEPLLLPQEGILGAGGGLARACTPAAPGSQPIPSKAARPDGDSIPGRHRPCPASFRRCGSTPTAAPQPPPARCAELATAPAPPPPAAAAAAAAPSGSGGPPTLQSHKHDDVGLPLLQLRLLGVPAVQHGAQLVKHSLRRGRGQHSTTGWSGV